MAIESIIKHNRFRMFDFRIGMFSKNLSVNFFLDHSFRKTVEKDIEEHASTFLGFFKRNI